VPKEVLQDSETDFRIAPIGTGPFYVKLWEENVKLVLRKNNRYFEKDTNGITLPYLEAVAITFLPDKQSGFMEFLQGKIDFISGLDPSYKDEILTAEGKLQPNYSSKIQMITGPYLNTEYLGFNLDPATGNPIDIRIRKALNYGFDRQKMIGFLRNNMGIPATSGIIPAGMPGFNGQKGYDFNPKLAQEYIKSYQKTYGTVLPKIVLSTNPTYLDIAEYLQREWQKMGLNVQIDSNPPSTLRQAIATGKVSFFRASWIADYPDAENYLSLFYSENFSPNGPNYTHFSNSLFDPLFKQSYLQTDIEARSITYQKMDSIIIQEAPIIPLFYDKVARFTQKNISGLGMNPLNNLHLKRVKKK
jgi:peptide/nickel transport system substrate-binding protein